MARELDFDNENFEKEAGKLEQVRPQWFKVTPKKTVRVQFLGRKLKYEAVYDLNSRTEKDPTTGKPKWLGSFIALNSQLDDMDHVQITNLIASGDPDGKLRIDAKTMGKPSHVSAVLMLVYPTDDNGVVNKTHFKSKVFELAWLKLSASRLKELTRINAGLKAEHGKTIFDVDFKISQDTSSAAKFPRIRFDAQPESLYQKHNKDLKLDVEVDALVKKELEKFGLAHPADAVKFLANPLSEQGFVQVMQKAGYTVAGLPSSTTPPPVEEVEVDLPKSPELEDDLDL